MGSLGIDLTTSRYCTVSTYRVVKHRLCTRYLLKELNRNSEDGDVQDRHSEHVSATRLTRRVLKLDRGHILLQFELCCLGL